MQRAAEHTRAVRILVVDDEWGMRTGAKRILEREGYEVETAGDGAGAIALATPAPFDVCLVDLKLPDVDGLTLLKEFHGIDASTVCIVITAYASLETAIEATRRGAWDFLPKPFTPQALRAVVARAAERRLLLEEADRLRREREERLLELAGERSRTSTILSNLTTGVVVVNEAGELALFNTAALSLLAEPALETGAGFLAQLPAGELREAIARLLDGTIEEAIHTTIEAPGVAEGQTLSVTAAPVPGPRGGISGRTISIRDVTDRAELDRAKSNFVRIVSHEVKAPVGAVIGFIDMILEGYAADPEKQREYLARARGRLEGLVTMVKDLLAMTRQETRGAGRSFEPVDLVGLVRETVASLEPDWRARSIAVEVAGDGAPPVVGDEPGLGQVFTNLLSNAIKYNRPGGRVTVSMRESGAGVETTVTDTGVGMDRESLARIWEPFYRIKSAETKDVPGTGLGLSIVRAIVETHKGRIEVTSSPGEGTTFTLWLPRAPGGADGGPENAA
ncbi:MAG: response regulator [Candidatus Krumholzibacteriota bacterium]|nr:response regulator [Candidatus Krumholzibacteriota bacterium]